MDLQEEIRKIEEEIRNTPYNKATQHHIGKLKAKLARLREQLEKRETRGSGRGYAVRKEGDATVVLLGYPSVGKSTLLNRLTNAKSETADYPFTTIDVIPGIMDYKGARIQLLDVPGIIEGASRGKGRGREVLSVVRNADLIIIVTDVFNTYQVDIVEKELYNAGIRLNETPPAVAIRRKETGGILITKMGEVRISDRTIKTILMENRIHNADVVIREDITEDQLIDVIMGNRKYLPGLVVVNKVDLMDEDHLKSILAKKWVPVSAVSGYNMDFLKEKIYENLGFIRVYLKPKNEKPDFNEPLIVRKGATIRDVCSKIHRDMVRNFRYAKVWGNSARFRGQRVGLDHRVSDEDIVTIYIR